MFSRSDISALMYTQPDVSHSHMVGENGISEVKFLPK